MATAQPSGYLEQDELIFFTFKQKSNVPVVGAVVLAVEHGLPTS